jgi:hypothetical protein
MPARAAYLVQGPGGTFATVIAHSVRGAMKLYVHQTRLAPGDVVRVKLRGGTEPWREYKVTR